MARSCIAQPFHKVTFIHVSIRFQLLIRRRKTRIWLPNPTFQQYAKLKPDFVSWKVENTLDINRDFRNSKGGHSTTSLNDFVFTAPMIRKPQHPSWEGLEKKLFSNRKEIVKTDLKQKSSCSSQTLSCVFIQRFYLKVKSAYSYYWEFRRAWKFQIHSYIN